MKILLVDDETIVRFAFNSIVDWASLGCEITEASNGAEALETYKNGAFDVVITDIKMPVMSGMELVEEIRKLSSDTIIVLLTAFDDFSYIKQAFLYGATDYILKPEMSSSQLLSLYDRLNSILESRNLSTEKEKDTVPVDKQAKKLSFLNNFVARLSDSEEIKKSAEEIGLSFEGKEIAAGIMLINEFKEVLSRYNNNDISIFNLSVENIIEDTFEEHTFFCNITPKRYFFLLCSPAKKLEETFNHFILEKCDYIVKQMKIRLNTEVKFFISSTKNNSYKDLNALYIQALELSDIGMKHTDTVILYDLVYENQQGNYLVKQAKRYIDEHFTENIGLRLVSQKINVSEEHLSRLFTESTGESFSKYLSGKRIDRAKELLQTGKYRIYEVAEMSGYSSNEHFARVFKSIVGISPKDFMNNNNTNPN